MSNRLAVAALSLLLVPVALSAVVPDAPQNLSVNVSGNTVTLTWNAPSTGGVPTGYVVNAALSPGGALIASLPVSGTSLTLGGVPNGVYYVHVRGVNIEGASAASNEIVVAVPGGTGGCTSPPDPPIDLAATVSGSVVTLTWSRALDGCAPTAYSVQAGSAAGLSNLAILNVGAATTLTVSAPPGTYYVRVVATNAFGGSVASGEIIVNVGTTPGAPITIGFGGLAGTVNRSPVTTYSESGFTITPTAQDWVSLVTFGNPAPFIQFSRNANQTTQIGSVSVTANGGLFRFQSVDLYSSVTSIPHEVIGLRSGLVVFTFSGIVPNTSGGFATVANTQPTQLIDTLLIRISNPETPCCNNPVGVDNIVLSR